MAGDKISKSTQFPKRNNIFDARLRFSRRIAPAQINHMWCAIVRLLAALHFNADVRNVGVIARKFMPLIRQAGETTDLVIAYYYQAFSLLCEPRTSSLA